MSSLDHMSLKKKQQQHQRNEQDSLAVSLQFVKFLTQDAVCEMTWSYLPFWIKCGGIDSLW